MQFLGPVNPIASEAENLGSAAHSE